MITHERTRTGKGAESEEIMKKIFAGMAVVFAAAMLVTGCGEEDSGSREPTGSASAGENGGSDTAGEGQGGSSAEPSLHEMNVEEYVSLGDYSSFEVRVDKIGVDDEELKSLMSSAYIEYVTPEHGGIMDRAVAMGDTVVIDYEGKKDGVAFGGGTAQGAHLAIGSGQFIDGFEEGLVGVMPGETVDLNLTFPEGYGNADLAGQAVVFTVTVQCILPKEMAEEDMEDVVAASMGISGVSNVAEFRQYAYDYLYSRYEYEVQGNVLELLLERCEFQELPEELLEPYRQMWHQVFTMYASMYQLSLDQYTSIFHGADSETLISRYAEQYLKQDLALQAIANKEGLGISDEELQTRLSEEAEEAGYASIQEYVGTESWENYRNDYMNERVTDYLIERTTVSEAE